MQFLDPDTPAGTQYQLFFVVSVALVPGPAPIPDKGRAVHHGPGPDPDHALSARRETGKIVLTETYHVIKLCRAKL